MLFQYLLLFLDFEMWVELRTVQHQFVKYINALIINDIKFEFVRAMTKKKRKKAVGQNEVVLEMQTASDN